MESPQSELQSEKSSPKKNIWSNLIKKGKSKEKSNTNESKNKFV